MAWDSKSARRRHNSSVSMPSKLPLHTRQASSKSIVQIQPKSTHVSDSFLQDFLDPSFDPAAYLNATLPPLQVGPQHGASSSARCAGVGGQAVPLSDLSNKAQTLLSQLNAHTTRLSGTLTQLTDDILRSGSRLAYQVELLRGETLSFAETMNETLQPDVDKFLPGGIPEAERAKAAAAVVPTTPKTPVAGAGGAGETPTSAVPPTTTDADSNAKAAEADADASTSVPAPADDEPEYIKQLRTLTLVRERLDAVIKTFGDAMEFVFPPSELSVGSGFLSVSAPEPGNASFSSPAGSGSSAGSEQHTTEEKGQQVIKQLREEVARMLRNGLDKDGRGNDDPITGIERAAAKVEELKELTVVWKGTAEEKGRVKFIEGLAKMVEERHRELMREAEAAAKREAAAAATASSASPGPEGNRPRKGSVKREDGGGGGASKAEEQKTILGGYGLMSQLQKLRSGL